MQLAKYYVEADARYPRRTSNRNPTQCRQWSGMATSQKMSRNLPKNEGKGFPGRNSICKSKDVRAGCLQNATKWVEDKEQIQNGD